MCVCGGGTTAHTWLQLARFKDNRGLPEEKRKVRFTESAVDVYTGGEAAPTGCLITVEMGDG